MQQEQTIFCSAGQSCPRASIEGTTLLSCLYMSSSHARRVFHARQAAAVLQLITQSLILRIASSNTKQGGALPEGKLGGNFFCLWPLRYCHSSCPGDMNFFSRSAHWEGCRSATLHTASLLWHGPHSGKQTVSIDTGTCHCRSRRSIWRGGRP